MDELQEISPTDQLEKAKRDIANSIAHELRSPLTSILGFTELIRLVGPVTSKQEEFLREIQANIYKINEFIGGLSL